MSQPSVQPLPDPQGLPPPPRSGSMMNHAVTEVGSMFKRLDPNMLAVLLLTVILNGMFFYVYLSISERNHEQFMAALNSCPVNRSTNHMAPLSGRFDQ